MTQGVRYPTLAFQTGGAGQANDGIPPQPFETFCYDSALMQAKIENFNVVPYTSVLPKELFGNIVSVDKVANHNGRLILLLDQDKLLGAEEAEAIYEMISNV